MTLPLPEGVTYADPRLTLTPKAVEMAKAKLLDAGEPVYGLRLGVKGGGCAGYSYVIDYATKIRADKDLVYHFDGLHVVVDQKSIEVLKGSTLDWERRLMGYGFKWINPNAKNDCGCGESFDVA
ncbi:MAG: iron-sulfur cluster assembly accessory protein [Sandaracinaceae bacterium]|jgi:iron-sulfur cluster assembly protein|nr:iron-sulfur cluster assembly accessory protein [Sandaracinaceae bacterium]MBP7684222.1 iron-sulfur cluster assembly accessory protein [Deltaproteobacteria bacterium]MBK6812142.1 iron-sulfur cluster assembly accessory protein [Sandaracinaceae bacterium]MBK7775815.1 iron-sulfur cluster assembly accessory protein [Sandaracinaceae bacterium]MBK8409297.1 iron-sulfur cluster assembly accessory protein [Sandaracinaceae bacterium]